MKKINLLFLVISIYSLTFIGCKKAEPKNPLVETIKSHSSEMKFSFKKNGAPMDLKMGVAYYVYDDTILHIGISISDLGYIPDAIDITINKFNGVGTYIIEKNPGCSNCGISQILYSLTPDSHNDINEEYYVNMDATAKVIITKYDKINSLLQGTFEAKELVGPDNKKISLTEGEFFISTQTLSYANRN